MSLSANRSSKTTQTIILFKMASVPTTEDLRYALARAVSCGKQVELPFRNPNSGLDFKLRVIGGTAHRGPLWSFFSGEGESAKLLWTKECHEVIIVQGQIRLQSSRAFNSAVTGEQEPAADCSTLKARFHL